MSVASPDIPADVLPAACRPSQAVRIGSHHQFVTSYRGTFPSADSSSNSSGPSASSDGGGVQRALHTVLSPASPYAYALFPSAAPAAGLGEAKGKVWAAAAAEEDGLLVALSPPGSLNSLLALTKSPFAQAAGAAKPTINNAGPVRAPAQPPSARGARLTLCSVRRQVTDMTPSNSTRNTRPTAQMLKLDGHVFELPHARSSAFIPGLAAAPDGLPRDVEFVVRVTGASGAGGLHRGLLVEAEWFPLSAAAVGDGVGDDDDDDADVSDARRRELEDRLRTFLAGLVNPPDGGTRTLASAVRVSTGEGARAVERGRTGARLLLDLLRTGGVI